MTLPERVPLTFKEALVAFAQRLRTNFSTPIDANPEDQLKAPMLDLLRSMGRQIEPRTEAQVHNLGARPDIGVTVQSLLCGYVELKAPGKGARTNRLTGPDRKQWEKFKVLPNILYTDGTEWALYRSGEPQGELLRFAGDVTVEGVRAFNDDQVALLHTILVDFLSWQPIPPNSAQALAETLAPLCGLLRSDVLAAVQHPESALAQLAGEWRQYLFPEADNARFADAYAQTLTYALLLARLNGEEHLTTVTAADALDSGHGLLAQALRILTQPQARNEISVPVDLLERTIRAVEPARLRDRGDPWLYFYEEFLSIYDPKLRNSYGVYYTPMPVIKTQVRLGSELLEQRFDKPLSYADESVIFLDPGAGTAAYPLTAVEHSLEIVNRRFGPGMVAARATECARNFNAFEILVGPYAVAHLRFTKLIVDKGGTLPPDGIRVFLTDTLESPHANPPKPPLFARVLTEEHRRAQYVKSRTRVLVCMGNPPYDREQDSGEGTTDERKGGWVRHGDPNLPTERPILLDFVEPAKAMGAAVHVKNLYNDYVYFWRWALWKLFENPEANGPGIISFITASSYLRGPGFVGMRQKMRESFDELWIIDLEGDQHGARKTENVFAIQTPVAIALGVRYGEPRPDIPARLHYVKITGTQEQKYEKLDAIRSFQDVTWQDCFDGWTQPFLPRGEGDYYAWPLVTDIFPWQHSGVQFKRTWPIGETTDVLDQRWRRLLAAPADRRGDLLRETSARRANGRYKSFTSEERLPPLSELLPDSIPLNPVRYSFRSFDRQWILPDVRLCDRPRPAIWAAHSDRQIYMASILSDVLGRGPAASIAAHIPDLHYFSGRGGKDIIPLYRNASGEESNINRELCAQVGRLLGENTTAEDLFSYAYAILSSPNYVDSFSEELTVPGPRLPITRNGRLFSRAVELGRRLIWLHTYGQRFIPEGVPRGQVLQGAARCMRGVSTTPDGYPENNSFDISTQILRVGDGVFQPVSAAVWNFSLSDLRVLQSWLNYRMKANSGRSSSPLDEVRPETWTAAMTQELLELIWVLEATIDTFPGVSNVFNEIMAGETIATSELPMPTLDERRAPADDTDHQHLLEL